MKRRIHAILPLAALALTATSANATVIYGGGYSGTTNEVTSSSEVAYNGDVSNSDLLHGITASPATGWNLSGGATPGQLTDGVHGLAFADSPSGHTAQGAWTTVGATATFTLGVGANGLGYDLSSITSIASWQGGGLGQQAWTIEVRTLGGSFGPLATVDYQPSSLNDPRAVGSTKVTMTDLNVIGIDAIRVTAAAVDSNNNFIWRELDITGVATVPEPSSAALLGLGCLALILRRRK